jgi:hypothetical protein
VRRFHDAPAPPRKLTLARETIRVLHADRLRQALGAVLEEEPTIGNRQSQVGNQC